MRDNNISDEYLNSFIDDQLDPSEKSRAFAIIRQDEALKERVCEFRGLKEMIKHAYDQPPVKIHKSGKQQISRTSGFHPLAASLLLVAGAMSGWFAHVWTGDDMNRNITGIVQAAQFGDTPIGSRKVIVQVSNSNPMRLKATLDETESLLESYRHANRQIQVEVIANKRGVDLLRSDVSPYKHRISMMHDKYPNLSFYVCGQTMGKLQNEGESVRLLPHTEVATSAVNQVTKRLSQGWGYIKI